MADKRPSAALIKLWLVFMVAAWYICIVGVMMAFFSIFGPIESGEFAGICFGGLFVGVISTAILFTVFEDDLFPPDPKRWG